MIEEEPNEDLKPRPSEGSLVRASENDQNALKIQEDIDRLFAQNMLSKVDAGEDLAGELNAINMALPSLGEIDRVLDLPQLDSFSSNEKIEQLLSLDKIGDIEIEGIRLKEILDNGVTSAEEKKIIRRGIQFLKHKMYREAIDYWSLNMPPGHTNKRLHLILTLLLALAYNLSGNVSEARNALRSAKESSLFKTL
jgi:hypothetical protein